MRSSKKSLELVELTGSNLRAPWFVYSPSKLFQMLFMGSLPAGMFPPKNLRKHSIWHTGLACVHNELKSVLSPIWFTTSSLNHKQNIESIMSKSNITEKPSKLMRQSQGTKRRTAAKERGLAGFHCPTSSRALFGGCSPESWFLGLSYFHSHGSLVFRFTLGRRINFNCAAQHRLYLGIVLHFRLRGDVKDSTRNDPNITYNMLSTFLHQWGVTEPHQSPRRVVQSTWFDVGHTKHWWERKGVWMNANV